MTPMARLSRRTCFLAALVAGLSLTVATSAALAAYSGFVSKYCNYASPTPMRSLTRQGSIDYAYVALREGYQWGGGCWNDNNIDDSPGDPPQNLSTGGEGPDCSGFVFKTWREPIDPNSSSSYCWGFLRDVHGPYSSGSFKEGAGAVNVTYPKSGLIRMDALASYGHIGMIYAHNGDGTDLIMEAKGEAYGTNLWARAYRSDSSYSGVRRLYWDG
jgi:hypothetical protein